VCLTIRRESWFGPVVTLVMSIFMKIFIWENFIISHINFLSNKSLHNIIFKAMSVLELSFTYLNIILLIIKNNIWNPKFKFNLSKYAFLSIIKKTLYFHFHKRFPTLIIDYWVFHFLSILTLSTFYEYLVISYYKLHCT